MFAIVDILAISAGALSTVAAVASLRSLIETIRAKRALSKTLQSVRREKLERLQINTREAQEVIEKAIGELSLEQRKQLLQILKRSDPPARDAFIRKVVRESLSEREHALATR